MKLQRMGAVALTIALLGVAGVANADTGAVHHEKCHVLGNGNYIKISPAARSFQNGAGHATRNPDDIYDAGEGIEEKHDATSDLCPKPDGGDDPISDNSVPAKNTDT